MNPIWKKLLGHALRLMPVVFLVAGMGCGLIAEKDQIKVAKLNDRYITRGDLARVIREMAPEDRPTIRNKGDLLRVLSNYLDEQIKRALAAQLESANKIYAPREAAEQQFDVAHPEYRDSLRMQNPEDYELSKADVEFLKSERELGIEKMRQAMLADAALTYQATEALRKGEIQITEGEYAREYKLRQDELKKFEAVGFVGIWFPASWPEAAAQAARVREHLDSGANFDEVVAEFRAQNPALVLEATIENDPNAESFVGFWRAASGAQPGNIIGPVFLPSFARVGVSDEGQPITQQLPEAYLVLKVLRHRPETVKTLEEAKPDLIGNIVIGNMMERLREENGVEIYDDKLPDPSFEGETL
jgi:hypothetical protein